MSGVECRGGGFDRDAGQFRERQARGRKGVADAPLELGVAAMEIGTKLRCAAQIGARGEDAEGTRARTDAVGVNPVRGLAGFTYETEPVGRIQMMNREPVEPLPPGPAVAVIAPPRGEL